MGFVSYDFKDTINVKKAILPAVHTTAQTGLDVDCKPTAPADRTKMVTFIVTVGVITDGTIDFTVEESNDAGSNYTAIPAARVFGTLSPALTASTDETVLAISVKCDKRYCRINTVETVASAGYALGAVAILQTY